jgi:D-3-phosphoglycerate dehydrogenase
MPRPGRPALALDLMEPFRALIADSVVLSAINNVFSENGLNISAQYLQTNADIGYVVVDTDTDHSDLALEGIRRVEGTIRTRVLF